MGFRPFRPFRTTPVSVAMPGGRTMAALCAISASVMPIARPNAVGCTPRAGRCQDLGIPAISASDMPMGSGLAWQAWDGELREHGSSQLHMLPHRIEVRKSTSGAAARRVTQQWRCGRLSTRANMMPVLPGGARQTYATTLLRNVKDKTCTMAALRARKIILAYRHRGPGERGASAVHHE